MGICFIFISLASGFGLLFLHESSPGVCMLTCSLPICSSSLVPSFLEINLLTCFIDSRSCDDVLLDVGILMGISLNLDF